MPSRRPTSSPPRPSANGRRTDKQFNPDRWRASIEKSICKLIPDLEWTLVHNDSSMRVSSITLSAMLRRQVNPYIIPSQIRILGSKDKLANIIRSIRDHPNASSVIGNNEDDETYCLNPPSRVKSWPRVVKHEMESILATGMLLFTIRKNAISASIRLSELITKASYGKLISHKYVIVEGMFVETDFALDCDV